MARQLLVKLTACMAMLCGAGAADLPNTPSSTEGLSCNAAGGQCTLDLHDSEAQKAVKTEALKQVEIDFNLQVGTGTTRKQSSNEQVSESSALSVHFVISSIEEINEEGRVDQLASTAAFIMAGHDADVLTQQASPNVTVKDANGTIIDEQPSDINNLKFPLEVTMHFGNDVQSNLSSLRQARKDQRPKSGSLAEKMWLAEHAYCLPSVWSGNAAVYIEGCSFAFRGTNDALDWLSNALGAFSVKQIGNHRVHGGFVNEFEQLRKAGLDQKVDACSNPQFIGHSLGGAIAIVARLHYGKGEVTTFGAPPVFKDADPQKPCRVNDGMRVFHTKDPIPAISSIPHIIPYLPSALKYHHGTPALKVYSACQWRYWWSGCGEWKTVREQVDCTADSSSALLYTTAVWIMNQFFSKYVPLVGGWGPSAHYHHSMFNYAEHLWDEWADQTSDGWWQRTPVWEQNEMLKTRS